MSTKEFVLTLDHSNFYDTISKYPHHTSQLAEYEMTASILGSNDPPLVLAKVDLYKGSNIDFLTQFNLGAYPAIMIFRDGGRIVETYCEINIEAETMVGCLNRIRGPFPTVIKSTADITKLIDDKKIIIVGVFPKFSGEEYQNFIAVAEVFKLDYYDFGYSLDAKHLPHGESLVSLPVVRLFKPFDEPFVDTEDFNVDALKRFVEEASTPVVTLCNCNDPKIRPFVDNFILYRGDKVMLFTKLSGEGADSFKSKYREVAEKYRGQGIRFMLGDLEYEASMRGYAVFGVKESQVSFIVIQTTKGLKYIKANLEPDDIAPFMEDYKAGNVDPYVKSEPIPRENNEPVKVVVADNIQEMVWDSSKNAFHLPWGGHDKEIYPILDEVALHFKKDPDMLIAKFNMIFNETPRKTDDIIGELSVKDIPFLIFKTGSGKVEVYDGVVTKEDIIHFINKNRCLTRKRCMDDQIIN